VPENAAAVATDTVTTTRRRPFWRRRWFLVGAATTVVLVLLAGVVGQTWGQRLGWFGKKRGRMAQTPRGVAAMATVPPGRPSKLPAPRPSLPKLHELQLSTTTPQPLFGPETAQAPELPLVGQISPCLALTSDPVHGLLLTSSLDSAHGILRWYDKNGLTLRGSCRLSGPAYHMVFDSTRGQIWTVTSVARVFTLSPLGDYEHAIANLHVYDLRTILESTRAASEPLAPIAVIPERAPISGLVLSPDASRLFYLVQNSTGAVVKRIDLTTRKCDREVKCGSGGTMALSQSPGGARLYVLAGASVYALDPNTMIPSPPVRIIGSPESLCAGEGGKLFLSERRKQETVVHALDWSGTEPRPLASWQANLEGRIYLRNSPDGKHIYLGSSAVLNGEVRGMDITGPHLEKPALIGKAASDRERLLRGTLMVSPDGKYVITGSGLVFRTSS
jgi:hypothetical protein